MLVIHSKIFERKLRYCTCARRVELKVRIFIQKAPDRPTRSREPATGSWCITRMTRPTAGWREACAWSRLGFYHPTDRPFRAARFPTRDCPTGRPVVRPFEGLARPNRPTHLTESGDAQHTLNFAPPRFAIFAPSSRRLIQYKFAQRPTTPDQNANGPGACLI